VHKKLQLTGRESGRLTIIQIARIISKRTHWICQCSCDGLYFIVPGNLINSKKVQSCGCLRRDVSRAKAAKNCLLNTLPAGEGSFNQLCAVYKFHAGKRKLAFDLTHEEFKNLTKGNCHFCGVPPYQEYRPGHKSGSYIYNGVDRLVNEDGYTISNSVSCCGICNDMKRNRSVTEFISACEEIVNHQKRCQERPLETAPSSRSDV